MAFVYQLLSLKDNRYYIGSTPNLKKRFEEHQKGWVHSTKYRRPLELNGYREMETLGEARVIEHKYKQSHGALERDIKKGKFKLLK